MSARGTSSSQQWSRTLPAAPHRGRYRRWRVGIIAALTIVVACGCSVAGAVGDTQNAATAAPDGGTVIGGVPELAGTPSVAATNARVPSTNTATKNSPAAGSDKQVTVPSSSVDPSGVAMPVGNIPGWRQVFADDFSKDVPLGQFPGAVGSRWTDYSGTMDTSGNGVYDPGEVVSIQHGLMDLYLHSENGVHLVAAPEPIISSSGGGMTYGRYEIRFKAQPVSGYKAAWLLWPDSNVWPDGEIDFPEGNLNSTFYAFMHHVGDPQMQDTYAASDTFSSWHTATIDWTPNSVTFLLDGKVIGASTNRALIPDTPMHWVLQTETQLDGGAPSDSAASHVDIDWITVYALQS